MPTVAPRGRQTVLLGWIAGLLMVALATSVAGLVAAPVAVPASLYAATRRTTSWAVRVPLLLGALALTALVALWLANGAGTGTTTGVSGG
jgi:hypothetical protein